MTAKAREESIIYAIPIAVFRPFVAHNSEVLDFLLQSFASNTSNPNDKENLNGKLVSDNVYFSNQQSEMQYFQLLNYKAITDEKDTDFAIRLTKEKGLAAIPLSVFYTHQNQQQLLRFCFAKKEETLEKAAEIICTL